MHFFFVKASNLNLGMRGGYSIHSFKHGLRTPNEGTNQRNLKFSADVADKICFGRAKKFGIGI